MNDKIISKILKKLPPETTKYAVRDITLLTSSIFGETHFDSFQRIFYVNFSLVFWFVRRDGNVVFHRSGQEYDTFSKIMGDKFIASPRLANDTANKLIAMTDEINEFIKINKKLKDLVNKWSHFSKLYMDFFAYHQTVFWTSVYLTNLESTGRQKQKMDKIVNTLDNAYKYNEKVVPNVDSYFRNLQIDHLIYDEINKDVVKNIKNKPKRRSILFLDRKTFVISFNEASKIDKAIMAKYNNYLKNLKEIKGLAVSAGLAKGRVRLVKDLNRLNEVKKGDILVVTQTRPQFNAFIKNAGAIVTDEGGLLSHASLLAREFKIPCIVGTKNATTLLKNGSLVEVDANQGTVKIIKK